MKYVQLRLRPHKAACALGSALAVAMLGLAGVARAAQPADHFKAGGPDKAQGGDDSLFYPNDFESAVAARPDPTALTYFSLCRRAPFDSSSLYSAFANGNANAIVGDTQFTLVDGTQCYEPQNEQNIAVNPRNSQNVVTSSNDYRYGFRAYVYVSQDGGQSFVNVLLPY